MKMIKKVGIRNLKTNLSRLLKEKEPLAVTNNGRTIGVYLPLADNEDLSLTELLGRVDKQYIVGVED